jgi:homoserine kinase
VTLAPAPLRVRVPGSTSNLGPGFDFAGLALSIFLDARLVGAASGSAHELAELSGTAADWPRTADNVFLRAFDHACEALGAERRALRFAIDSRIPIARGLGSSGAAIAAGLLLARAHARKECDDERLCAFGLAIEGHPDNTSASLLGGCTLAIPRGDGSLRVIRQPLHRDLGFAVAWPHAMLSTKSARAVLPREVPFADAVENPWRLAALLEGLRTGDPELLKLGNEDRLHVRHRLALIEHGERALGAAREAGAWLATVSGSGSALFSIGSKRDVPAIASAMQRALAAGATDGAEGHVVTPVIGTPVVTSA